jgi:hypothetical protein
MFRIRLAPLTAGLVLALGFMGFLAPQARADNPPMGSLFPYRPFNGDIQFTINLASAPKNLANAGKLNPSALKTGITNAAGVLSKTGVSKVPPVQVGPAPNPSFTVNVKRPLDAGWKLLSTRVFPGLPAEIDKLNLNFSGFHPYNIRIVAGQPADLKVLTVNNTILLQYTIRGNSVQATTTTPDAHVGPFSIGAPRALDPRFALDFDLMLSIDLTAQLHGVPVVGNPTVQILNPHLRGANFTGDLLSALNDFVSWMGGPNFRGIAERKIAAQSLTLKNPLTSALQGINSKLAPLTQSVQSMNVVFDGTRVRIDYSLSQQQGPVIH